MNRDCANNISIFRIVAKNIFWHIRATIGEISHKRYLGYHSLP